MAKKKLNENDLYAAHREDIEQSKIKLALIKENFEYQNFFIMFLESDKKHRKARDGVWPGRGFERFGLVGLRFFIHHPFFKYDEIIDLINPQKDINGASINLVKSILPRLFYDYAVKLIKVGNTSLFEGGVLKPIRIINERGLKPWERIYEVDLSKKKTQIMKEFEGYLDRAYFNNKEILNNKRDRRETLIHLEVWKLRKKRKNFSQIAKALNITQDAAKKSFYRAYELTQGKSYDPENLKKEVWCVKKSDIKQTCDTCSKRNQCESGTLCPDVLRYIDQDKINRREKLFSNPSFLENLTCE